MFYFFVPPPHASNERTFKMFLCKADDEAVDGDDVWWM